MPEGTRVGLETTEREREAWIVRNRERKREKEREIYIEGSREEENGAKRESGENEVKGDDRGS